MYPKIVIAVFTLLAVAAASARPDGAAGRGRMPPGFTVYDSLVVRPDDPAFLKPRLGMAPLIVDGRSFGFERDPSRKQPTEFKVRALARRVEKAGCPLLIDIEHLPMDVRHATQKAVDETLATLLTIIRWLRNEHPGIVLGLYDLPGLNYYDATGAAAAALQPEHPHYAAEGLRMRRDRAAARRAAAAHRELFAAVDFLCPQLYTYTRDDGPHRLDTTGTRRAYEPDRGRLGWFLFAAEKVRLCRELAPNKPVVPIVWPRYHKKGADGRHAYVPGALWRAQLETVRLLCDRDGDGVILWDSRRDFNGEMGIDVSQAWWKETKSFTAALRAGSAGG